jgi:hypothetical protein
LLPAARRSSGDFGPHQAIILRHHVAAKEAAGRAVGVLGHQHLNGWRAHDLSSRPLRALDPQQHQPRGEEGDEDTHSRRPLATRLAARRAVSYAAANRERQKEATFAASAS